MPTLLLPMLALLACTTTKTPQATTPGAEAPAEQAATEDTGGVSAKAPGQLAVTLRTELANDPDAQPQAEGIQPQAEGAQPQAEGAQPQAAQPSTAASTAPTQATMPSPGKKTPPPCEGISSELARAIGGDSGGLELDAEGRVHVTYEFTSAPEVLPTGFLHETSAMGHGQGWCPPALLCELAGTAGITRVRTVRHADPKPD